jgi:hypothetical protein
MSHPNDTEHVSAAAASLTLHYYNLLMIKAHWEEQGMSVPTHYLAELTRVDNTLRELLDREGKLRKDGAPQHRPPPSPPSYVPPSPDRRQF